MANKGRKATRRRMSKQKEEFIEAFAKSLALISSTCRKVGISRPTFYNWYNSDELFAEQIDDIRELCKDSVENEIFKKIKDGDTAMIIFYAKTRMKDRGYVERQELTGKDGEELMKAQDVDLSTLSDEQKNVLLEIGKGLLNKKE